MHTKSKPRSVAQLELLRWAAGLGVITAEALAARAELTQGAARARLLTAERAGLLTRSRPLADVPALYMLTRAGVSASGLRGLEPARLSAASAAHAAKCAAVAVALERAYPDHRVMGERELRRQERASGRPFASAVIGAGDGAPLLHRPDLVLWPEGPHERLPVAVEVELTVKAPRRLLAICRGWARCRDIAGCLYLADGPVERPLARAIADAQAVERIALVPLTALLAQYTRELSMPVSTVPSRG